MKNILHAVRDDSFISIVTLVILTVFALLTANHEIGAIGSKSDTEIETKKSQDFSFVATGDFGCGDVANKTVAGMITKKPELVLALGDLSYQKSADCWLNIISPLDKGGKLKIAFGEHDVADNAAKYYQYMRHFNLSKPYYSFDHQNVHFLVMTTPKNSRIPYLEGSEQYNFTVRDLKKASNNNSIDWIIVSTFRPFYSSNTTHPGLDKIQDTYHQLFEKYGVDVVLQAHNHNYQRTYPLLYNQTKQSTPIITDKSVEKYDKNLNGQIFLTVGTGGEDSYNFTGQAPYVVTQFTRHGFLDMEVTNNGSKLTGTFYENRAITDKDHFTITKKIKKD